MSPVRRVLLVKQFLLLDPKDVTPLKNIPFNPIPGMPSNELLLSLLEGSRRTVDGDGRMVQRLAVKVSAVKKSLTQRLEDRVGMGDSSSSDLSSDESDSETGGASISDRDMT